MSSQGSGHAQPLRGRLRSKGVILIVDDEEIIARTLQEFLQGEGFEVDVAANAREALALAERLEPDIALCDIQLPGPDGLELLEKMLSLRPETLVLMITAYATVENAVAAFQRGAQDYLIKPIIFDELLAKIDRLLQVRRLSLENQALRRQLHAPAGLETLVGGGAAMETVKTLIRKVAPARSNVLITGESGTGKELVARALHELGTEPEAAFLAINCAAIPHDLLENQLFGHVRGAFTGADRDHAGLFVAAGEGTVFLDEIGEMPLATQAKMLRAIETREVLPIGATRPAAVKARVIAATNKNLIHEVAQGQFRADFYYRLNVVTIPLPPLRARRDDIPELVRVLLARHARRLGKRVDGVDNATMRRLTSAPWKGNVRELDNALERAVILADHPILTVDDLPADLAAHDPTALSHSHGGFSEPRPSDIAPSTAESDATANSAATPADHDNLRDALAAFKRDHIRRVLERCRNDKREAARRLGLGLSSLYRKLEEHGLR